MKNDTVYQVNLNGAVGMFLAYTARKKPSNILKEVQGIYPKAKIEVIHREDLVEADAKRLNAKLITGDYHGYTKEQKRQNYLQRMKALGLEEYAKNV